MKQRNFKVIQLVFYVCAVLLFISILRMPSGYYDFLRFAVTTGAALAIIFELKKGFNGWIVAFALLAILFNPIEPIYLYKKSTWVIIDFVAGLTFLIRGLKVEN